MAEKRVVLRHLSFRDVSYHNTQSFVIIALALSRLANDVSHTTWDIAFGPTYANGTH